MDKKEFIFKIGSMRRDANLSARRLSLELEMNEGYINRLETSEKFLPSMEVFFKMLKICGYTAEKFFYHDTNNFEKDMELLNKFKNLSDEQKEALLTLINK